ncbi:hypothetical protein ACFO6R_04205 [Eubacterium multiforme]|uniref:Uncharacterized protein n=1 Tax=Eubacterium multiforme TaxID=83339 RepID=A0ABT9UV34_9FIRM|nr:hypothetical protein [Eubacterium multiforme]MDQ0150180.1 hypothetical protein [Eubacterium multiforme]
MSEKEKTATNNQWISTPVETEGAKTSSQEKTAGNNQWTSTNKNPMKNYK